MKNILLGDKKIGENSLPFIIAEMSGNHNQSLERALKIVDEAALAGVDALKVQTYTADTMTIDFSKNEFFIQSDKNLWKGKSLFELYKEAYTPWEWHKPIQQRCKERGIIFFSTPFDETAVDFLEDLKVPFYKVASFENTDLKLIKKIATTGKPIIISTGMASIADLHETVSFVKENQHNDLILLKCTSAYPSSPKEVNLKTIPHLREMFDVHVGLSDHTLGLGAAMASVALGATVIEKHFTLSRADGGVDSAFSLEPDELAMLVKESKNAFHALGKVCYEKTEVEKVSAIYKRSLYVVKDVKKGEVFSSENVRSIRPGLGLPTKYYEDVIGRVSLQDIEMGTPLTWKLIF